MYYCEDSFKQFLLNEASDYIRLQESVADLFNSDVYTGKLCYLALYQWNF